MKQRILISYFFRPDSIPLGYGVKEAFQELGWEVEVFDSQAEHSLKPLIKPIQKLLRLVTRQICGSSKDVFSNTRFDDQYFREKTFLKLASDFQPHWILVIRGNGYREAALKRLRELNSVAKLLGWWVKDPRDDAQMIEDSKHYDSYFCIHQHGYGRGDGIHHLPALGVYRALYQRPNHSSESLQVASRFLVLGGFSERRYRFLRPILASPLVKHLDVIGPGWLKGKRLLDRDLRSAWKGKGLWGEEMVRCLAGAYLVINVTSWDPRVKTGQNLRLFDVPSTGSLLLTDDAPEVHQYFKAGEHLDVFVTPEDLLEVCQKYASRPWLRDQIAQKGHLRSKELPTIKDRVSQMIALTS